MTDPSAIDVLRAATRLAHRGLEEALTVAGDDVGSVEYVRFVEALFGWVAPLEEQIWAGTWPAELDVPVRRAKRGWLEADLLAAGHDAASIDALPRLAPPAGLAEPSRQVGIAYVMEGAQLGGRALRSRLDGRLGPIPGRWLEGYGDRTGELWSGFVRHVNHSLASDDDARRAGAAAAETFDRLALWMRDRGATQ